MTGEILSRLGQASLGGAVAIMAAYLICRFLPRLSGKARCWLWWLVSVKLLVSLAPLPAIPLPLLPQKAGDVWRYERFPQRQTDAATPAPAGKPVPPPPAAHVEPAAPSSPWFADLLIGIWLVGVGVGVGGQTMALLQLQRLIAGAERVDSPLMAEAARRAELSRVPALYVSPSPLEPLTAGMIRPVVLVAESDLSRLANDELLPILTHECIHLRRGDLWLSLAPTLAQILFWFLPPVYLAIHEFELSREAACDERTIAALAVSPRAYGELLVKLSSPISPLPTPSSVMALSAGFQHMKRRIEMLQIRPSRRQFLGFVFPVAVAILVPYRLTSAALTRAASGASAFPNLDLSDGLTHWKKTAMGSNATPHPFYTVGLDTSVTHEGRPSAFVQSTAVSPYRDTGDGGVLRYDSADVARYQGKRIRLSAFIFGKGLTKRAFLFLASDSGDKSYFATSPEVGNKESGWQKCECVFDMPEDAAYLSLGLRLEGEGSAYGSGFTLEIVDKNVPPSKVTESDTNEPPTNRQFRDGLEGWYNDNPEGSANDEYLLGFAERGGRDNRPAAFLKTKTAKTTSYGTIMQNASPKSYLGKRIRFSAYLKGENAGQGELWMVVHDAKPEKTAAWNAESTGKLISGTTQWTKIEHLIDIPTTTKGISYGISSERKGTVWVDGFKIEILGPASSLLKAER